MAQTNSASENRRRELGAGAARCAGGPERAHRLKSAITQHQSSAARRGQATAQKLASVAIGRPVRLIRRSYGECADKHHSMSSYRSGEAARRVKRRSHQARRLEIINQSSSGSLRNIAASGKPGIIAGIGVNGTPREQSCLDVFSLRRAGRRVEPATLSSTAASITCRHRGRVA